MHEMALCTSVMDTVLEQAQAAGAIRVNEVHLVIGQTRDIVEDLFDGFFKHLAKGTIAEGCEVTYTRPPLTVRCSCCGHIHPVSVAARQKPTCPACGTETFTVNSGMEFTIASIDITCEAEAAA